MDVLFPNQDHKTVYRRTLAYKHKYKKKEDTNLFSVDNLKNESIACVNRSKKKCASERVKIIEIRTIHQEVLQLRVVGN
jgi:hypothetical protein